MTTPLQQMTAISAQLSVDLATVTDDRLIELCLLYRSEPDAYRAFADNLKEEIIRRFTAEEIANNDVMFSVIKNFSNQFSSTIPYFAKKVLEMAASVNRDIWFIDNLVMMQTFAGDLDAMNWLVEPKQADVLAKVLNNTYGLKVIGNSLIASTAVLTHQPSVDIWKTVPFLWDAGFWADSTYGMVALFKSNELTDWLISVPKALKYVCQSTNAINAMLPIQFTRVTTKPLVLREIIASTPFRDALMLNNTLFQSARDAIYTTVAANWGVKASFTNFLEVNMVDGAAFRSTMAAPAGFVFAALGYYSSNTNALGVLKHPNGAVAVTSGSAGSNPINLSKLNAISFNGSGVTSAGSLNASAHAQLWSPT